jgi:outer membrane lipoprotein-sorting protein
MSSGRTLWRSTRNRAKLQHFPGQIGFAFRRAELQLGQSACLSWGLQPLKLQGSKPLDSRYFTSGLKSRPPEGSCRPHAYQLTKALKGALLLTVLCVACVSSTLAATDAKTIMAGVYSQDTSHDATLRATLEIWDKDGHSSKKKFTLLRLGTWGDGKTLLRFTDPAELRGVTLLSINMPGLTDRQWIYTPATERVRSVAPRDRAERFAGSDFTYEDIAERSIDDFTYQMLPEEDVIENRKTFKVVATPVSPDRSQYKMIYYWVAQDIPVILHAEMYDQQGRKVRTMHASGVRKEAGMWGARRTEMDSLLDGTKSLLTFDSLHLNTGLDEALFTPEAMEKSTPAQAESETKADKKSQ